MVVSPQTPVSKTKPLCPAIWTGSLLKKFSEEPECSICRWERQYGYIEAIYMPETCYTIGCLEANQDGLKYILDWLDEKNLLQPTPWPKELYQLIVAAYADSIVCRHNCDEFAARCGWIATEATDGGLVRVVTALPPKFGVIDGVTVEYWVPE